MLGAEWSLGSNAELGDIWFIEGPFRSRSIGKEQFIRVCKRFISVNKTHKWFDLGESVNVCLKSEFAVKPDDT